MQKLSLICSISIKHPPKRLFTNRACFKQRLSMSTFHSELKQRRQFKHPNMKNLMLSLSLVVLWFSNVHCTWSVRDARSFDDDLRSLEDFNQYIRSVRKLYNRPKFAPSPTEGMNNFRGRGGFEGIISNINIAAEMIIVTRSYV